MPRQTAEGSRTGRKDGGELIRGHFNRRVFPFIGDRVAKEVRKSDLMAILDTAKAEGMLRTANVLLGDLKQMLRFALTRELIDRNPLDTVTKRDAGGKETERDRVLAPDEIKALRDQIPAVRMGARNAEAIWIILATACRVGELMAAEWRHVDLEAATWYLPDTKNGREHTISLSPFALAHFRVLHGLR